ncbi:MAG: sigma-70 family RNA polymerase sigma factor [Calditrichaceae bacterium]
MTEKDKKYEKQIWQKLYSHEGEVYGYIKNAVNSSEIAKDLCQDVYLQALKNLKNLDPDRSLKNWLITVARNRVVNFYLQKKRRQFEMINEDALQTEMDESKFDEPFQSALSSLPERQKHIFILREIDGLSYDALSREMNLSVQAATSLISRARAGFTKAYLLYFLPQWFRENAGYLEIQDIARFINSFEPPDDLLNQIHRKSQAYFDQIRNEWDHVRNNYFDESRLDEIFSLLNGQENKNILDLGSGTGFVAIHNALRGAKVTGIEINQIMLRQLIAIKKSLSLKDFSILKANISQLPVKSKSCDQVFISLALHHVPDPADLIFVSAEILQKGGYLVVVDFMRHNNKELADKMRDLWLGFNPLVLRKWARKAKLTETAFRSWHSTENIDVFYQIFKKQ